MDGGPNKGVVLVEMPLLEYHKRKTKKLSVAFKVYIFILQLVTNVVRENGEI
jgi:hypothetical protein